MALTGGTLEQIARQQLNRRANPGEKRRQFPRLRGPAGLRLRAYQMLRKFPGGRPAPKTHAPRRPAPPPAPPVILSSFVTAMWPVT